MKLRNNFLYLVVFLVIASLFLVACERPLPGGYNDPDAGSDLTVPEVPESVPGVDSEAYPADEEPAAPEEAAPVDADAYPADAADAAEAYPAEEGAVEQEFTAEDAEAAPEGEEAADAEAPAEETPAEETAAEGEGAQEEGAVEEAAETPGTHTVAEGENLYRIGLLYGISWLELAEANGIVDPANLSVGQVLIIPSAEGEAGEVAEAEDIEAPSESAEAAEAAETEEAAEESAEAAEEGAAEAAAEAGDGPRIYVVQQGDNLFRIGINHGVDWTEIAAVNGIVGAEIHPGQELIIPDVSDTDDAEAAETEEAEVTEGEADEVAGEEITYVVQEGDSIYSVAFEHGIPWTALVEANGIEAPYTLEVGQTLIIVAPSTGE